MPMTTPGSTLSRRAVVAGMAATSVALSGAASAQQPAPAPAPPPRVKGPPVWLDLDQKELDDAYDQIGLCAEPRPGLASAATQQRTGARTAGRSQALRLRADRRSRRLDVYTAKDAERAGQRLHPRRRLAYGLAPRTTPMRPRCSSMPARISSCSTSSTSIENGGRPARPMAEQVRRAVAWVYKNAESFGGDPERFYISGPFLRRASGRRACSPPTGRKDFGLPPTFIKGGGAAASGMFDLKPVRLSKRSELREVHRREPRQQLSAQRHLDKLVAPVARGVRHAAKRRNSSARRRDFAAAVKAAGKPVVAVGRWRATTTSR